MTYNQRTITAKLQRIDICDLMLACTASIDCSEGEEQNSKWITLHDKLKAILDEFDEKHAQ